MQTFRPLVFFVVLLLPHLAMATTPAQNINVESAAGRADLDARHRAEIVARMGETLLVPSAIDGSVEVFRSALALDPQNDRANFYLALLKPILALKGFYARIEPAVLATNEAALIEDWKREKANALSYFTEGTPDLKTDADLRGLQEQVNEGWNQAHRYLRAHAPLRLTLNSALDANMRSVSTSTYTVGNTTYTETRTDVTDGLKLADTECRVQRLGPGHYQIPACPYLTFKRYALDYADVEALRGHVTGQLLLGYLVTAYDMSGSTKLFGMASTALKNGEILADETIVRTLTAAGAGALTETNQLARVRELGVDIFAGLKWLSKMQASVCPANAHSPRRPGHFFSEGICLSSPGERPTRLHQLLQMAGVSLAGGVIDVKNGHGYAAKVQLSKIYSAPVKNLIPLAPNGFDAGGDITTLPDPFLNGIFVKGDAPKFYNIAP